MDYFYSVDAENWNVTATCASAQSLDKQAWQQRLHLSSYSADKGKNSHLALVEIALLAANPSAKSCE